MIMYSIQQQYNLVPGNYAKEMAAVSVWPHLKSMAVELATGLWKGAAALLQGVRRILRRKPTQRRNTKRLISAGSI